MHRMITMHARPRQTGRQTDIMAIERRFVLTLKLGRRQSCESNVETNRVTKARLNEVIRRIDVVGWVGGGLVERLTLFVCCVWVIRAIIGVIATMSCHARSNNCRYNLLISTRCEQCDFRFDLFFSFSFSFSFAVFFFVLVIVLPTTKEYQTCWRRRVDDLPKYRSP